MLDLLSPGSYVLHADRPDWGIGQIQSVIGNRITVNFEHCGKQLLHGDRVSLISAAAEIEARRAAR